jgi:hypothetical protein
MYTRPTSAELLDAVSSLLRDLRDHPESASAAQVEVALEVTGVIERRIENEPRWLVGGIREIEDLSRTALARHANDPDLRAAIDSYNQAWPAGLQAAEALSQYEAAGALLSTVSDVSYRHADIDLIDQVFQVHTRRFERLSHVVGDFEAKGRT